MTATARRGAMAFFAALMIMTGAAAQPGDGRLTAGDLIFVDVYRHPEFSTTTRIDASGGAELPFVGVVSLAGLTQAEATDRVRTALQRFLRNPRVSVSQSPQDGLNRAYRDVAMRTELLQLNNSSAVELATRLQGMVSVGGNITADPATNSLIITDTQEAVTNILEVIGQLDQMQNQLQQVRIEVKIAEVVAGKMKEIGVRWFAQDTGSTGAGGGYYAPTLQDPRISALRGPNDLGFENERLQTGDAGQARSSRRFVDDAIDRRLQVPAQLPLSGQMFFGLLTGSVDIGVLLDALVADDNAQLLANPNILTVNHKRAEIRRVEEFPYREFGVDPSGRSITSTKFLDLGIILGVTPHVLRDPEGREYIKLELEPEVSIAVGQADGVPIRSVRSSQSEANVRDGQTLVIGGIYKNDRAFIQQRVPGLGSLPVVGTLFRRTENRDIETELMVFVTPRIHDTPDSITVREMIAIGDDGTAVDAVAYTQEVEQRRETRRR